jgi:hypothetical protein
MERIIINVEPELAKAYQEITPIKREEIEGLFLHWLKQIMLDRSPDEVIADMQKQAKTNGLTEEILQEIIDSE